MKSLFYFIAGSLFALFVVPFVQNHLFVEEPRAFPDYEYADNANCCSSDDDCAGEKICNMDTHVCEDDEAFLERMGFEKEDSVEDEPVDDYDFCIKNCNQEGGYFENFENIVHCFALCANDCSCAVGIESWQCGLQTNQCQTLQSVRRDIKVYCTEDADCGAGNECNLNNNRCDMVQQVLFSDMDCPDCDFDGDGIFDWQDYCPTDYESLTEDGCFMDKKLWAQNVKENCPGVFRFQLSNIEEEREYSYIVFLTPIDSGCQQSLMEKIDDESFDSRSYRGSATVLNFSKYSSNAFPFFAKELEANKVSSSVEDIWWEWWETFGDFTQPDFNYFSPLPAELANL